MWSLEGCWHCRQTLHGQFHLMERQSTLHMKTRQYTVKQCQPVAQYCGINQSYLPVHMLRFSRSDERQVLSTTGRQLLWLDTLTNQVTGPCHTAPNAIITTSHNRGATVAISTGGIACGARQAACTTRKHPIGNLTWGSRAHCTIKHVQQGCECKIQQ